MMQQGINTLEIDQMAAPQAQGIETLGSMEDAPMIPNGGIQGAVPEATEMLAAAGREGDVYIIHAAEGDTVIPEEVLAGEGGPQIREMLFRQMAQMGVDPERYVVGNELNSINPETGLPEFFFKKVFESIKKVFKKVAPIVLPIALSFTPLGPILGSAIGSGIGNLIAGGDAKSALKAAAFGGITAGIASGVGGMMSGAGATGQPGMSWSNFQAGIGQGLPQSSLKPNFPGVSTWERLGIGEMDPFKTTAFTPTGDATSAQRLPLAPAWKNPDTGLIANLDPTIPRPDVARMTGAVPRVGSRIDAQRLPLRPLPASGNNLPTSWNDPRFPALQERLSGTPSGTVVKAPAANARTVLRNIQKAPDVSLRTRGLSNAAKQEAALEALLGKTPKQKTLGSEALSKVYDPLMEGITGTPSELSAHNIRSVAARARLDALNLADGTNEIFTPQQKLSLALKAGDAAVAKQQPGLIRQALPLFAGSYLLASLDDEEQGPFQSKFGEIDQSLVRQARLFNDDATPDEIRAPARIPTTFQPIDSGFARFQPNLIRTASTAFSPIATGAYGGETQNFPPRIGAISGPGTEKSDDVPAMLSDGEFVMTARAVRGAGNGSRRQGVKNLYDIMRNFEAVV